MAVASLVLGILSLVFSFFSVWVSLVLGIVGIILGVQGRREPDKQGDWHGGIGLLDNRHGDQPAAPGAVMHCM